MLTFYKTHEQTLQSSSDPQSSNNQKCFIKLFMIMTQSSLQFSCSSYLQCGFQEDDWRSTSCHQNSTSILRTNQSPPEMQQRSPLKRLEPSSDFGTNKNKLPSNSRTKTTLKKNFYFSKHACLIMKIVCNFLYYYLIDCLCNFFNYFFKHVHYFIKIVYIKNKGTLYNHTYFYRAEGNDSKSPTTTYITLPTPSTQPHRRCTLYNQSEDDTTYHPSRQQTNHTPSSSSTSRLPRHPNTLSSITCPFFRSRYQ